MQGVGAMRGLTQGPGLFARMLKRMHKSWHGYVFIAPAMTIIIVFAYIAMIFSLYVSFHRWDIINPEKPFVGFDHYLHALDNKTLWNAFKNTAYFTFVAVPIITVFSLCLALWAHWAPKGRGFFRTVYFIPTITPMVVVALIWLWIYSPNGPFSRLLELLKHFSAKLAEQHGMGHASGHLHDDLGRGRILHDHLHCRPRGHTAGLLRRGESRWSDVVAAVLERDATTDA